jgi:hypothetical protein
MAEPPGANPTAAVDPWIAEANAMRELGEQAREHAIGLPEDSPTRAKMLDDAASWLPVASARGVESPVVGASRAEVAAARALTARRRLAGMESGR